jgi:lipid II:glycine glycyltransferase (peptidoglycan interpeptide bridge formation enzyme)
MQSSLWMRFKQEEGYRTCRLGLFEEDSLVGGAVLYSYGEGGLILCPHGPVVPWHDTERAREGLRRILSSVDSLAEEWCAVGMRIEPNLPPPRPSVLRNWRPGSADQLPVQTRLLHCSLTDQQLLEGMTAKARYNTRLSERRGVTVRVSQSVEDVDRFYPLLTETGMRCDFYVEPYTFFRTLVQRLFTENSGCFVMAEQNGVLLAANLLLFFGDQATYLYGASSTIHRNLMPVYPLHLEAVREARRRGCTRYDLYGCEPHGIADHPYAGISRFKRSLGGWQESSIGSWDLLFYDRLADRMADLLTDSSLREATYAH